MVPVQSGRLAHSFTLCQEQGNNFKKTHRHYSLDSLCPASPSLQIDACLTHSISHSVPMTARVTLWRLELTFSPHLPFPLVSSHPVQEGQFSKNHQPLLSPTLSFHLPALAGDSNRASLQRATSSPVGKDLSLTPLITSSQQH